MVVDAFNWSEQFGQIFMLRSVTRISHARGDVKLGPLPKEKRKGEFKIANRDRFICMPAWSRKNRVIMIDRLNKIREATDTMSYNQLKLVKGAKLGVIASGIAYGYAMEALRWLKLEDKVSVLKIGTPYPLPEKLVKQICSSVPEVVVVEELEPFVENHVAVIAQKANIPVKIHVKTLYLWLENWESAKLPKPSPNLQVLNLPLTLPHWTKLRMIVNAMLPMRPPTLCAGCPHRASFHAINVAVRKAKKELGDRVLSGDIGCYSLGSYAPLNSYDTSVCMAAASVSPTVWPGTVRAGCRPPGRFHLLPFRYSGYDQCRI
jgi:indolepyruvate ferredoxin oxidoreductase alpha subunit